jgi:hypothetical protein
VTTSDFQTVVDAIVADLTTNVPGLRDALPHKYAAYDPEQQVAEAGERHLAVWPTAEDADTPTPLVTGPGGDILTQLYAVVYWEHAGGESDRGVLDQEAARELLALHNAVRARFYAIANIRLGGTTSTRYAGARFPERSGQVRWFAVAVRCTNDIVVT